MRRCRLSLLTFFVLSLFLTSAASASIITIGQQDFTNGDVLLQSVYNAAQADDPDLPSTYFEFRGADLNTSPPGNWQDDIVFAGYTPEAVTHATLTLGLWDHDSAATGDQVKSFTLGGVDLTADLNALLNASGGVQGFFESEYNVYTLTLDASTFADLSDGSATFSLEFQNGRASNDRIYNGVGLDFATLSLNENSASAVPEPSSLLIFGAIGLGAMLGLKRKHVKKNS